MQYGSEVNGVINSITQFLGLISLMNLGVGAVVLSSFFKPIAEKNNQKISEIISSSNKFFRKIAAGFLIYIVLMVYFYPNTIVSNFDNLFTGSLIIIISMSLFAEYYFGITYRLLLEADQKLFINNFIIIVTTIVNLIVSIILIKLNIDIRYIKLVTTLIYITRPIFLNFYVNRNYTINYKVKYSVEPIKQKWNGLAQHFAFVILERTDIILLTLFSTLKAISIYSVYSFIVLGLRTMIIAFMSGYHSLLGDMLARNEIEKLNKTFEKFEFYLNFIVSIIFGCTFILIIPFIKVYTFGIEDANYIQPVFGILIIAANFMRCIRIPYNFIILGAGHFKETQNSAFIEMLLNIVISLIMIFKFGLIGVAFGTLIAMSYKTLYLVWYLEKYIMFRKKILFLKRMIVNIICFICIFLLSRNLVLGSINYLSWIFLAIKIFIISFLVCLSFNLLIYKKLCEEIINSIFKRSKY